MKVLILCGSFMNSGEKLKDTISSLGYETELLIRPRIKRNLLSRIKIAITTMIQPEKKRYREDEVKPFSEIVLQKTSQDSSIVILDSLGINLCKAAAEQISKTNVLVKKMGDSVLSYPYLRNTLKYYDLVTTYETADMPNLYNAGAGAVQLVSASYHEKAFFPIETEKDIDICFVGKMFPREHAHRRKLMESVVKAFPDAKFAIYGVYAKKHQIIRYLKWKYTDGGEYFKNKNIPPADVNGLYNRSKICININSFQTINTWSARLPEMLGSGAFVISESTPDSKKEFDGCCEWFSNEKELIENIQKYLHNRTARDKIAEKGYLYAKSNHTKGIVTKKMMDSIEALYEKKISSQPE